MSQDHCRKPKSKVVCKEAKPNPRKTCVREILDSLLIQQNDYQRLSVEKKNLEEEYKKEMIRLEFPCKELKRVMCCQNFDKAQGESFMQRLGQIHEIQNCFIKRIEMLDNNIKGILENGLQCWKSLRITEEHLKKSHTHYIEELKREAVRTTCPQKTLEYERKICKVQKSFTEEMMFIHRTETTLQPFFDKLKSLAPPAYVETDAFKAYKWMPEKKSYEKLDEILVKMKTKMGPSIVKGFTQMHIHKPVDEKGFLSLYLLNLERNQKLLKDKMEFLKIKEAAEKEKKA